MRPTSFPDPKRTPLLAGIFASDLLKQAGQLFEVFADRRTVGEVDGVPCDVIRLPITIPFGDNGLVLVGPANLDSAKKPGTVELVRPQGRKPRYRYGIGITLLDQGLLPVPGLNRTGIETEPPVPVSELTFALADKGFAIVAYDGDGAPLDVAPTEHTACLLATALVITLGVKLTKAERGIVE